MFESLMKLPDNIMYDKLVPVNTAAIQNLYTKYYSVEDRIAKLEAKISKLEAEISKLKDD